MSCCGGSTSSVTNRPPTPARLPVRGVHYDKAPATRETIIAALPPAQVPQTTTNTTSTRLVTTTYPTTRTVTTTYTTRVPEKNADERRRAWEDIQLRLPRQKTLEAKEKRKALFKQFDDNGSCQLSFSEVDAGCRNILHLDDFTNNLTPILRNAFDKANGAGGDRGSSEFVEFLEFRLMLCYIYDYFELQTMFDKIDSNPDGQISRAEFRNAIPTIEKWGLKINDADATFDKIDTSRTGSLSFDEFAKWATAMKLDADGDPDNVK